eukprot:gb/GECH01013028.1/.p1 GENE.gb/GECH01013028.1/~~gb/GECH01013028.1/.p1  ORF type:complete len:497 (+),score=99.30 gb/GECH01013028.1/:1-1491(+)
MLASLKFEHLWNEEATALETRRTKIVCTIGPKTQPKEKLQALLESGMNVVRLNFSHGSHEFHATTIRNIHEVASETKRICGVLLDTKGPEIRTGKLKNGKEVQLKKGQELTLTQDTTVLGDENCIAVDYPRLAHSMEEGKQILIDDGLISCRVRSVDIEAGQVRTEVENSGALGETKGVNLPNVKVELPAITEKDQRDLLFGVDQGVDIVAASFVRKASDVLEIRKVLGDAGAHIKIISKIENREGIDNFEEILAVSDGIMVARGDLGVEIPLEKVCLAQKMMISKCNAAGKPVITATQMLETMVNNPRPTRAEATDVANAVFDGTDCVMLSGETAKGDYPAAAVSIMSQICGSAEGVYDYRSAFLALRNAAPNPMSMVEAVCSSCVKTATDLKAQLIITITETGNTARLVSKYRPFCPVFVITAHRETARQLMVSRGLFPVVVGSVIGTQGVINKTIRVAKEKGVVKSGDFVVVTSGMKEGVAGTTNLLKCITVD